MVEVLIQMIYCIFRCTHANTTGIRSAERMQILSNWPPTPLSEDSSFNLNEFCAHLWTEAAQKAGLKAMAGVGP